MVIFVNIKTDHSITQLIFFICYKVILVIVIFCFYDFENNFKKYLIYDLFILTLSVGITGVDMILKRILLDNIEKLCIKNEVMMSKFKNILNTMKSPLFSINFKKNVIFFNVAFTNFIKKNYHGESNEVMYLFDEMTDIDVDYKLYINDVNNEDKFFFEKLENSMKAVKNAKKYEKFLILKKKILILNKIFKTFHLETLSNMCPKVEYFDIFELIKDKRVFLENEHFDRKGTYKIDKFENFVEINWRKTVYSVDEEVFDIMFHDLTVLREIQFPRPA